MADEDIQVFPVMRGVRALVVEPDAYLLPPPQSEYGSVAVGAAQLPDGDGALFIGVQSRTGQLLTAVVPSKNLPALADLLQRAAVQIQAGVFERPEAGCA